MRLHRLTRSLQFTREYQSTSVFTSDIHPLAIVTAARLPFLSTATDMLRICFQRFQSIILVGNSEIRLGISHRTSSRRPALAKCVTFSNHCTKYGFLQNYIQTSQFVESSSKVIRKYLVLVKNLQILLILQLDKYSEL